MGDFKRLHAWQLARRLAVAIYRLSQGFPREERFGLTSQLRRAGVSVAANIAEGAGKKNDAEFGRFLRIARGSLHECEALLILARDLGLVDAEQASSVDADIHRLSRMLNRLIERPLDPRPSTLDRLRPLRLPGRIEP